MKAEDRQTDGYAGRQVGHQTDVQTGRQADRWTDNPARNLRRPEDLFPGKDLVEKILKLQPARDILETKFVPDLSINISKPVLLDLRRITIGTVEIVAYH
ncbi:hypothetical protein PoB_007206300 [Plakobranchus ocellatus]|uniref:Uncharacterized protein n=1 Tax=Plakobranchus ocellatus TaxID=259542 RepID=A0AAV4DML1_9GAST|nr:hypothetical protein PoB_007206300 [Plakobranchus ocellatus]